MLSLASNRESGIAMAKCSRCENLARFLADERKRHEETQKNVRGAQTVSQRVKARNRELEKLIADASMISPLVAKIFRQAKRMTFDDEVENPKKLPKKLGRKPKWSK